ncbi:MULTISPECIES: MNIO family bufferin maturase [unclassified Acidovorax]|uniref:MNIO family bufferin maturase n=1 Tax=unclassified Acidovorax TaxID=2684926 RepID=UPI003F509D18
MAHDPIAARGTGFGLGLRTAHYADFLAGPQPLDWLEIITDNYLIEGGKPLAVLDTLRRDYPMAMHGVAMSIGAAQGVDIAYLRQVKALAERIEPLWVSDHLCWIGPGPQQQLHDLYPLPYTDASARHVIAQVRRAQDVLGRRLVLENVSSYIRYAGDSASEWQFLAHIAQEADCLLLVDVNNIYVSSVNHGFDPLTYLDALPAHRVQQIHLAGHSDQGDHIIDTHDHPVAQPVWDLYARACERFGAVATMVERDDHIPPLAELLDEMAMARSVAAVHVPPAGAAAAAPVAEPWPFSPLSFAPQLQALQRDLADRILAEPMQALDAEAPFAGRLGIYHHAYRARLAEVLADTYAKTWLYLGSDTFEDHARQHAVAHPPTARSLNRYGEGFVGTLRTLYPDNPELHELAQLDWDLRTRFDGADVPALDAATAPFAGPWLARAGVLHPSALLRTLATNAVALWNAIHADEDVPEAVALPAPVTLLVWRKGHQPHFRSLGAQEAVFIHLLQAGASVEQACDRLQALGAMPGTELLAQWLAGLLREGLVGLDAARGSHCAEAPVEERASAG